MNRAAHVVMTCSWMLAFASCQPVSREVPPDPRCRVDAGEGNRPYFVGGADVRKDVDALLAELAAARGEQIVEVGRRLVARGETAIPALQKALVSSDSALRSNAAYFLGVLKDRRTIPDLRLASTNDTDAAVRYEAAGALLEMGDPSGFPVLVDGLSDVDARRRAKCIDVLAEATHERYGFEPDGDPAERSAAIHRWRTWLAVKVDDAAPATDPQPPGSQVPPK